MSNIIYQLVFFEIQFIDEARLNKVQSSAVITQSSITSCCIHCAGSDAEYQSDTEPTKGTHTSPWRTSYGVPVVNIPEKIPCYNRTALYCAFGASNNVIVMVWWIWSLDMMLCKYQIFHQSQAPLVKIINKAPGETVILQYFAIFCNSLVSLISWKRTAIKMFSQIAHFSN